MTMLRTKRLVLRKAKQADLGGLHAVYADPEAMAYWSSLPHETTDQTEGFLWGLISTLGALSK